MTQARCLFQSDKSKTPMTRYGGWQKEKQQEGKKSTGQKEKEMAGF
jgi:hypothetical protein